MPPSHRYDRLWSDEWRNVQAIGPLTHTRYRLLNGLLPPALPQRCAIVDIGCGNGTYLAFLHRMLPHSRVVGIEPSPAAKTAAPPEVADRIITGDLLDVAPTLEPASFDLAICSEVLEHVADPEGSLRCIRTLLKPGGTLLVTVPGGMRYWSSQDEVAGHLRRFEYDDFRRLLERTGFDVRRYFGWGGPFALLYDRTVSTMGPDRVMRSGTRPAAKMVSRVVTALFRVDDLFKSRWGFQLVGAAVRSAA